MMARFNSKYTKCTVITCCAPMEDAGEGQGRMFSTISCRKPFKVPSHDVLRVIADFNARIWNDNEGCDKIMAFGEEWAW